MAETSPLPIGLPAPTQQSPQPAWNQPSPTTTIWNGGGGGCRFRYRVRGIGKGVVLLCLLINALVMVRLSLFSSGRGQVQEDAVDKRRLAVVVPAHAGDLRKALASLARWPKACSDTTLQHVELVLYYAGSSDDDGWSESVLPELEETAGNCFSRTTVIFGNLTDEVSDEKELTDTTKEGFFVIKQQHPFQTLSNLATRSYRCQMESKLSAFI